MARYYALDVFRGATVALMILVNNPGSWGNIYTPLAHAKWHGATPTDLVFPFFLFAVGNALAFVMPKFHNESNLYFYKKIAKRALLIFAIGLFLNWNPFVKWEEDKLVWKAWEHIRILGVLQRIATAYFFAALLCRLCPLKKLLWVSAVILVFYWLVCWWFGAPGDPYSLQGYIGTAVDKAVLGENHMYKGEGLAFEPEGLMSAIPAVVQVIAGYLAGNYIMKKGRSYEMLSHLFLWGALLAFFGLCWSLAFPINKKLWSSSYVVYTSGLALLVIATMIYILEFKNLRGAWSKFFEVFGKNPLFIFVFSAFLSRVLALIRWVDKTDPATGKPVYMSPLPWFYNYVCKPLFTDLKAGSLMYAICMIIFYWLIVYLMDRKKIYIKV